MFSGNRQVFRILRFFSVTSLLCILLAGTVLALFYRDAAIEGIVDFGERSNLMLTQTLLNSLEPELSEYLVMEEVHHTEPLPKSLEMMIRDLMMDTSVVNVTILDDEGIVVFSTKLGIRGENLGDAPGYKEARTGTIYSKGGDFGGFSLFFPRMPVEELISSFIPIKTNYASGPSGIFAVETDVSPLVMDIEMTGMKVFFSNMVIMGLLYLALLFIVRHADRIIKKQEYSLRERSRALEILSSQLITDQESEKKRVAHELHEGVAQTLSSIKFRVEHAGNVVNSQIDIGKEELEEVVPVLQELIKEVRSLAIEMRPPSLDEIGALATLRWYCHELAAVYPLLEIRQNFFIEEQEIPKPIKVVLYRAVQQRLRYLARTNIPLEIEVNVGKANQAVSLEITDNQLMQIEGDDEDVDKLEIVTLREFLTLSGAEVTVLNFDSDGKSRIHAMWPI